MPDGVGRLQPRSNIPDIIYRPHRSFQLITTHQCPIAGTIPLGWDFFLGVNMIAGKRPRRCSLLVSTHGT